jgi:ribosomal protein S18 acetylase RimI-like enzyme
MNMENIKIRECSLDDLTAISDICYKTGFMGEDLTGSGRFNDRTLFSYLFCLYYPLYEIDNCFIAFDVNKNKIIGYILGSRNTLEQEKRFMWKMVPKIALRMCTYTIFFYPGSFRAVLLFMRNLELKDIEKTVYMEYPAHLHMNILPEYQKRGVGSMLLDTFEDHMSDKKVSGIHIWTSNKNVKAVPFYSKHGYEIIYERENKVWNGIEEYKDVIFGKKIK